MADDNETFSNCGYDAESLRKAMEAERDVLGSIHTASTLTTRSSSSSSFSSLTQRMSTNTAVDSGSGWQDRAVPANSLQEFRDAITCLPLEKREAYETALEAAPSLVELETPAHRFLHFAAYNIWQASELLCFYWTRRKEVFGPDHYYLPLQVHDDDSPSALSPRAKQLVLSNTTFGFLPPDRFQRPVLFGDREKFEYNPDDPEQKTTGRQTMFYIMHAMSENPLAVTNGIVTLIRWEFANRDQVKRSRPGGGGLLSVIRMECFPMKIKAVHVVVSSQQYSTLMTGLPLTLLMGLINKSEYLSIRVRVHYMDREQLKNLEPYGFDRLVHLSSFYGDSGPTNVWLEERAKVEKNLFSSLNGRKVEPQEESENGRTEKEDSYDAVLKQKMDDFRKWAEDHCSKYKSAKLQSEVNEKKGEKRRLELENNRLQSQLECARFIAMQYEEDRDHILHLLSKFVAPMFPGTLSQSESLDNPDNDEKPPPADHMATAEMCASLAQSLLDNYILFLGRKALTGQWILVPRNDLTPEQYEASLKVQLYLWAEQKTQVAAQNEMSNPREAPPANNDDEPPAGAKMEEDETESDNNVEHDEGLMLDQEIESLQAHVELLREQNGVEKKNEAFLESSVTFSGHLVEMLEEYNSQHRDLLVQLYKSVLTLVARATASISQSVIELEAYSISADVLANYTCFNGRLFVNPAVAVVEWIEKTAPDPRPSMSTNDKIVFYLEHNSVLMDYLVSLCSYASVDFNAPAPVLTTATSMENNNYTSQQEQQQASLGLDATNQGNEQARRHQLFRLKRKKMLKRL